MDSSAEDSKLALALCVSPAEPGWCEDVLRELEDALLSAALSMVRGGGVRGLQRQLSRDA